MGIDSWVLRGFIWEMLVVGAGLLGIPRELEALEAGGEEGGVEVGHGGGRGRGRAGWF